ncbi:MAG: hypothetical protein CMJ46_14495 [Planctomyces sp.]|nr:hypothetical protein [Planctomyces sp.]
MMSSESMSVDGPLVARAVVLEWYLEEAADLASRSTFESGLLKMPLNELHWQQYVHWSRRLYSSWTRPTRQVAFFKSPTTHQWPGTDPFCAEVIVHNLFQRVWQAVLIRESRRLRQEASDADSGTILGFLIDCEHLTQKLQHFEQVVMRYLESQSRTSSLLKLHQLCRQWGDQAVELLLRDFFTESEGDVTAENQSLVEMLGGTNGLSTPLEAILPMEVEIHNLLQEEDLQSQPRAQVHRALLTACGKMCVPVE